MKYLITIISITVILLITHTTFGIYNDNDIASIGMGNTYIGFSIGSDHGKLFSNYHIGEEAVTN